MFQKLNSTVPAKVLFMSDLDGTWLSKNPQNRARLDREILEIKDEYRAKGVELSFGYITARPPQRVETENLPTPDWTVTYNGAQVHAGDPGDFTADGDFVGRPPVQAWVDQNTDSGFSVVKAQQAAKDLLQEDRFSNLTFQTIGQVVDNPAADASPFTTGLCFGINDVALTPSERVDNNGNGTTDLFETATFAPPQQLSDLAAALTANLSNANVSHTVSPIYLFHGKPVVMFDMASPLANKGEAVRFLQRIEEVDATHTIVAGDGGNDIAMMAGLNGADEGRRVIVVGGDSKLVESASSLRNAIIQPPEMDCSLGVLLGLRQHLNSIVAEQPQTGR